MRKTKSAYPPKHGFKWMIWSTIHVKPIQNLYWITWLYPMNSAPLQTTLPLHEASEILRLSITSFYQNLLLKTFIKKLNNWYLLLKVVSPFNSIEYLSKILTKCTTSLLDLYFLWESFIIVKAMSGMPINYRSGIAIHFSPWPHLFLLRSLSISNIHNTGRGASQPCSSEITSHQILSCRLQDHKKRQKGPNLVPNAVKLLNQFLLLM